MERLQLDAGCSTILTSNCLVVIPQLGIDHIPFKGDWRSQKKIRNEVEVFSSQILIPRNMSKNNHISPLKQKYGFPVTS